MRSAKVPLDLDILWYILPPKEYHDMVGKIYISDHFDMESTRKLRFLLENKAHRNFEMAVNFKDYYTYFKPCLLSVTEKTSY